MLYEDAFNEELLPVPVLPVQPILSPIGLFTLFSAHASHPPRSIDKISLRTDEVHDNNDLVKEANTRWGYAVGNWKWSYAAYVGGDGIVLKICTCWQHRKGLDGY